MELAAPRLPSASNKDGQYVEYDYGEFPTFAAAGNGGIWSSVSELAKYEQAIKQNIFLSKELTDESRSVYLPKNWADTINPYIGLFNRPPEDLNRIIKEGISLFERNNWLE